MIRRRKLPRPGNRSGWVYFITPEAVFLREDEYLRVVKIGYTGQHPHERLRALQTGSPVPLELFAYCDGGERLEQTLHQTFAQLRSHGEWFHVTGKLTTFLTHIEGLPGEGRLVPQERLFDAIEDAIFCNVVPHPSLNEGEYLGTADPSFLSVWLSRTLRETRN